MLCSSPGLRQRFLLFDTSAKQFIMSTVDLQDIDIRSAQPGGSLLSQHSPTPAWFVVAELPWKTRPVLAAGWGQKSTVMGKGGGSVVHRSLQLVAYTSSARTTKCRGSPHCVSHWLFVGVTMAVWMQPLAT